MEKLLKGIVDFRNHLRPGYREKFAQLALGQSPDALFIACSDSRVVPNLFASTDPGDLFVVRNVGNLIPRCGFAGTSGSDVSAAAAVEFAVEKLEVKDIIVCGHSECGAMMARASREDLSSFPHLMSWLQHAESDGRQPKAPFLVPSTELLPHNRLSQQNTVTQLKNILTYPCVQKRISTGKLALHAWWFDIARAEVKALKPLGEKNSAEFVAIDEAFLSSPPKDLSGFLV